MGYDCTLHLIDESSLARFAKRFVGNDLTTAPFDAAYPNAEELFAKVRAAAAGSDSQTAGQLLSQLALLWCAAETPHLYCRGFALSLWDARQMGARLPRGAVGSVEAQLKPIIDKHPELRGTLPHWFAGNYSTGAFVPSAAVPDLLAHVQRVVGEMVPGDRRDYQALVTVLRAAAARGLAYWEATDIGVAQAYQEWLSADPERASWSVPFRGILTRPRAAEGDLFVVGDLDTFSTHIVDLSGAEPRIRTFPSLFAKNAAIHPRSCRIALNASVNAQERPRRFSAFELESPEAEPQSLEVADVPFDGLAFWGDELLLFPPTYPDNMQETRGRSFAPVFANGCPTNLPALCAKDAPGHALRFDSCRFGDGTGAIVWGGKMYVDESADFRPIGRSGLEPESDGFGCCALTDDALLYISNRCLFEITRPGRRTRVLPLFDNVRHIHQGPGEAFVLHCGRTPEGVDLVIWWRSEGELTFVDLSVMGDDVGWVHYCSAVDCLVGYVPGELRIVEWALLAALPRISLDDAVANNRELRKRWSGG